MLKTIMLLVFVNSCNSLSCEFRQSELEIAIRVLHSRKILDLASNKLRVILPEDYVGVIPKVVSVSNKEIEIYSSGKNLPSVTFTKFSKMQSSGEIKIYFYASEAGYRYMGEIVFKCLDGNLLFEDIHYLSELN